MAAMKKIPSVIHGHHVKFRGWILHPYVPVTVKFLLILLLMAVLGSDFISGAAIFLMIIILPAIILSADTDRGDCVTIYHDRIEIICDSEEQTIYWKNVVQRNSHDWDVWQNLEPGRGTNFKIFIRFEYEDEHRIVDLTRYLVPRGKYVVRFKDIGYLRHIFLRSLITARPELRVHPVLYDYCETSPVDLSRTRKINNILTFVFACSILIGAATSGVLMAYISMTLSSALLLWLATGALTIGCVCLGIYLLRHHFIDPEDPKVREQRLSHIASNKLISK
jgi:hypothetical protein